MKLIIVEGPDCVGKDTLLQNLSSSFHSFNTIHFTAPPAVHNSLNYQFETAFKLNLDIANKSKEIGMQACFWNRSYLGEYVYGSLYRNLDTKKIISKIYEFEKEIFKTIPNNDIYAINLVATPEYLISVDDGNSFTIDHIQKQKELDLFVDVFDLSLLRNKIKYNIQTSTGTVQDQYL